MTKYSEILKKVYVFQIAFIIFTQIISISTFEIEYRNITNLFLQVQNVVILTLFVQIIDLKLSAKKWLVFIPLLFIGALIYYETGSLNFFVLTTMIFISQKYDYETILKIASWTTAGAVSLIVSLSFLNILPNKIYYRASTYAIRNSFGFQHPNGIANTMILICLSHIILRQKNWGWIDWLFQITIFTGIAYFLGSKTVLIILIIANIINVFPTNFAEKISKKMVSRLLIFTSTLIVLFFIFMMINYNPNNTIMQLINKGMTGRISQMNIFYQQYGISFLGQNIVYYLEQEQHLFISTNALILDNGVAKLLINFGVAFFTLFYGVIFLGIKRFSNNEIFSVAWILFILVIVTGSESLFLNPSLNFLLWIAGAKISNRS